ncbi:MAG: ABC transporter permease [Acetobacteraceae bacterium]|nr:ABC transporter permease [Acetobacteraceae bacterium]
MESRRSGLSLGLVMVAQAVALLACWQAFLALSPLGAPPPAQAERAKSLLLVGFLAWTLAAFAILGLARGTSADVSLRRLQHRLASGTSPVVVAAGRALGQLLVSLMYSGTLLCLLMTVSRVRLSLPLSAVAVLLAALVGVYGLGAILAGAALVARNVTALGYVLLALMLCLGVLGDPVRLGRPLSVLAELLPLTAGVRALRGLMVDQVGLGALWGDGTLPLLLLNSAFYALAGLAALQLCHRLARQRGTLGGA